ncbi:uncharacterized protein N7496_011907 [Penicillium cataractarum]|uniref:Beta-lactamase-related domain-containing protein n=1 Tax=Penicillium cataractarum TaxID=2100454 RepID=A0A9W9RIL3_9EURO|nr:uncharacterized protein N7496_011907 [Penicillium cataractarum]KAJ5359494.1 hypothetical protein N7496_011907 [Penicillium cataractarum]
MVSPLARYISLSLLLSSALSFTPCPLLGPAYPPFILNTNDMIVGSALENLTAKFDQLIETGTGPNGDASPNTTFSIALFSANKGTTENEPFFWEYHHTAPVLKKTNHLSRNVTKDSIYRIGGLTELFTVWSLLLVEGDQIFNDPVIKYLPELANTSQGQRDAIDQVQWPDVTVGQLASHMSGIARDYCFSDLASQDNIVRAGLPAYQDGQLPCCAEGPRCSSSEFIQHLATRVPVAPAGVTPSYSNMAFQLLGYIIEERARMSFAEVVQQRILNPLGMNETTVFAPGDSNMGVIPVNETVSAWSARTTGSEASISMFSSIKDLAIAGKAILNSTLLSSAQTHRWLKPVSHTSNPANSLGAPWIIYSDGDYPKTSMIDVYSILSNEGSNEGLYSSYLGLVPDYGVGYVILSADTVSPADLNAHADYMEVVLEGIIKSSLKQAAQNFGGAYAASNLNSSIAVEYDELPGLFIDSFISNGTDFHETLASLSGVSDATDLSIRLYPTQLIQQKGSGSKQVFRAVFQDKTELADAETATCVSWMNIDRLQYAGRGLDEFVFTLNSEGKVLSVEIPALDVILERKT